ncbi:sigma-54-dependent transcriptional regulator [Sandaracinus amylolyticus]|uniref:sigma-54-dependent transcriptional regulator n=1 Tax=Sandaracinus amylolyticus TaxID=927083 RepID=UPI001F47B15F|nr:sigma-54 dependent transcriptional regulator [Sandaracinus amylolyticus]UJR80950.1 Acetoacetate metabolism regulatory protein AtoC [Sandaracinus amylolyticus]
MAETILVVDDEKNIRRTLRMVLDAEDFETLEASSAEEAIELLGAHDIDLVILDVRLPGMSGIDAIAEMRTRREGLPILVMSGHGTISDAVQAVQRGALDFLEKPLDRDRVLVSVRHAVRTSKLEREVRALKLDAEVRYEMIGTSAVMRRLYVELEKVAPTRGRVLITGESGTGKELIARAIHRLSPRREEPFVKVNCAAIPAELIESELFGYERGAFTGAQGRKKGLFELAHGGTLFLDEIGDMSLAAQAKVLRALQSGEITRVGGESAIAVDVRVVAATNKDLEDAVKRGEFREDLFFRLAVVPIRSPSLRERLEDVPALAASFLDEFWRENGIRPKPIDHGVLEALASRPWPGNVRELRNVVERMAILSGDRITVADLPEIPRVPVTPGAMPLAMPSTPVPTASSALASNGSETLREHRDRAEREYILATLRACEWNISKAATLLGVERTNLHKKMRALGLRRE